MLHIIESLKQIKHRAASLSGQFFTLREYRSVLLFFACGLAVLLYREGKNILGHYFPSVTDGRSATLKHQNDSLLAFFSRKDFVRDSMQFWMPADSLASEKYSRLSSGKSKKELSLIREGVSLNSSGKDSLALLPGIGGKMAERILSYRSERGRFRRLHELTNVEGIGEKKFKRIEPYIRLN
ncbi:MAG TPA: helix-hairpin-helix domain-containing protein [Candidatus Kapabacteria bacterium]|nr:helix-hairpin-helix domain-containing protein [Candidatus Kapabacteria bacterium]